ncbi:hypothetical protein [Amycolatopsis speibonae]|uniref:Uncharacterized protein n=1 Tax=Amycolatopsis speibonae TaxID=1450224 RepID=A0ABV7P6E8_9PSEU
MSETVLPELPQELWRAGKLELAHGVRQFLQVMRVPGASSKTQELSRPSY